MGKRKRKAVKSVEPKDYDKGERLYGERIRDAEKDKQTLREFYEKQRNALEIARMEQQEKKEQQLRKDARMQRLKSDYYGIKMLGNGASVAFGGPVGSLVGAMSLTFNAHNYSKSEDSYRSKADIYNAEASNRMTDYCEKAKALTAGIKENSYENENYSKEC